MTRLMTVVECAEVLRVSPRTVQRWIQQGRFPAIKLPGGQLRVEPEAIYDMRQRISHPPRPVRDRATAAEVARIMRQAEAPIDYESLPPFPRVRTKHASDEEFLDALWSPRSPG